MGVVLAIVAPLVIAGCTSGDSVTTKADSGKESSSSSAGLSLVKKACVFERRGKGSRGGTNANDLMARADLARRQGLALAKQASMQDEKWLTFAATYATWVSQDAKMHRLVISDPQFLTVEEEVIESEKVLETTCKKLGG